jgi:ArsR family transcriptional regulator
MRNQKQASNFLKTISDINRLKILVFLKKSPKCVCEIFPHLKISQKLTSHHLVRLKKLGLVKQERDKNFIIYSLNKKVLNQNLNNLNSILEK